MAWVVKKGMDGRWYLEEQQKKLVVRRGTDDIRDKWYLEEQQKCRSFNQRVLLADRIAANAYDIDDDMAYKIMDINNFVQDDSIFKEASKYDVADPVFKRTKNYLSTSLLANKPDITSPFLQLAINKTVVATISKYMGHIPILTAIELWHSRYFDDNLSESQLWHCDWENPRSMKIFVNISDVGEENGPFTFIPASTSKAVRDKVSYTYGDPGYRIDDNNMFGMVDQNNDVVKVLGRGSLAFVDSCRCFHFGSRLSKGAKPRIMLMLKYLSPASINLMPEILQDPPFSHLIYSVEDLSSKYILGLL